MAGGKLILVAEGKVQRGAKVRFTAEERKQRKLDSNKRSYEKKCRERKELEEKETRLNMNITSLLADLELLVSQIRIELGKNDLRN